jgi:hypothetical protein
MMTMVTVLSIPSVASAQTTNSNDPYNTVILADSDQQKVVETSDENSIYVTTYDKEANTVQVSVTNISTGDVSVGVPTSVNPSNEPEMSLFASLSQSTFTNYEYIKTYGSTNVWELRRPDSSIFTYYYFKTNETSTNSSDLNSFKTYVDSINSLEVEIVLAYGASALSVVVAGAAGAGAIFTGGTLTMAAWASIVTAAGVAQSAVRTFMSYDTACRNAFDKYFTVYYNSTIL